MLRLTTAPARHARHLLAGALPRATAPFAPVPAAMGRRTLVVKKKKMHRPDPDAKGARNRRPREMVIEKRTLSEFRLRHKELEIKHISAEEAYDLYSKYMEALVVSQTKPSDDWIKKFAQKNNTTAAALHEVATFIWSFPNATFPEIVLMCNLFNSASTLGYDASALTLARVLIRMGAEKGSQFHWGHSSWAGMRRRVEALIKEGRDANALVVDGLMRLSRRTPTENYLALQSFEQALDVGTHATHFNWQSSALEGKGEAELRLGRRAQAEETFARMARLDFPQGHYRLATLRPDHPEYLYLLTKAASSGVGAAYEPLMNEHMKLSEKYEEEGQSALADRHRLDAAEWGLLLRTRKTQK